MSAKKLKKVRKNQGEYEHTTAGNTIISFYCPTIIADHIDSKRGHISRSIYLVELLKKEFGIK